MSFYSDLATWVLLGSFVIFLVRWQRSGTEMRNRLMRLDFKVDLLLTRAGIDHDPFKDLPIELVRALTSGRKIEAIKLFRQHTNVGLKEAQVSIDQIRRRPGDVD